MPRLHCSSRTLILYWSNGLKSPSKLVANFAVFTRAHLASCSIAFPLQCTFQSKLVILRQKRHNFVTYKSFQMSPVKEEQRKSQELTIQLTYFFRMIYFSCKLNQRYTEISSTQKWKKNLTFDNGYATQYKNGNQLHFRWQKNFIQKIRLNQSTDFQIFKTK